MMANTESDFRLKIVFMSPWKTGRQNGWRDGLILSSNATWAWMVMSYSLLVQPSTLNSWGRRQECHGNVGIQLQEYTVSQARDHILNDQSREKSEMRVHSIVKPCIGQEGNDVLEEQTGSRKSNFKASFNIIHRSKRSTSYLSCNLCTDFLIFHQVEIFPQTRNAILWWPGWSSFLRRLPSFNKLRAVFLWLTLRCRQ